jgi:hypothetical protein
MPASFSDLLKWLGERRDGFLISGAVLYGLGYLVWSYNAWRNNLGQLPALEFQYLIAGIIPAAIIAISWAGTAFFYKAADKIKSLFQRAPYLKFVALFFATLLTAPLMGLPIQRRWIPHGTQRYSIPLFIVAIYMVSLFALTAPRSRFSRAVGAVYTVYRYLLPLSFCWFTLIIYFDLYPAIPQELGGPQPRCAYVDLLRDDVSPSTMSALVSAQPSDTSDQSAANVVRSNKLYVYFSSSDYLLVRSANPNNNSVKPEEQPLYQLPKEVIRVVRWCK